MASSPTTFLLYVEAGVVSEGGTLGKVARLSGSGKVG
jgi:hypothetical protein